MDREALKRHAGAAAAQLVTDGQVVGLGTGSTVRYTIEALGEAVGRGLDIIGIPTSLASERLAQLCKIPLTTLDEHPELDITIDGADEVDPMLRPIKGGGGALTREKVVAASSKRFVVVADAAKRVDVLGSTFPLPVEVLDFAKTPVQRRLEAMGARVTLRKDTEGNAIRTDNGNPILDARFNGIADPEQLAVDLDALAGVVCQGLFLGMCTELYVANPKGVQVVEARRLRHGV